MVSNCKIQLFKQNFLLYYAPETRILLKFYEKISNYLCFYFSFKYCNPSFTTYILTFKKYAVVVITSPQKELG